MSNNRNEQRFGRIDGSRRAFVKKGVLASSILALGGSTFGSAAADEHDNEDGVPGDDGDHVLMLYPDAVEHAEATVVTEEIDWRPWDDEATESDDETDDETNDADDVDEEDYRTHVIDFNFSASHVSHVFVPADAGIESGETIRLGEIEEFLRRPGEPLAEPPVDGNGDDGDDTGDDGDEETDEMPIDAVGEALLVRIALVDEVEPDVEEPEVEEEPEEEIEEPVVEEEPEEVVEEVEEIEEPDANVAIVEIDYPGEWSGSISNLATTRTVEGEGPDQLEVELDDEFDVVSAIIQKIVPGDDERELTVRIVIDDEVVLEESTTVEYGLVSLRVSVS